MQTCFILVRLLSVPTSSPQTTHLRFFTNFVNSLQLLNTPWDPFRVFRILTSREANSLLITTMFLECTEEFFSFRDDNIS